MPNVAYRDPVATYGGTLIEYIGLVDESGTELEGGSPAYARKAVTWLEADNGTIRIAADMDFDIPASSAVAGWRGFSAATGGTAYGIIPLNSVETFASQGVFRLLAAGTALHHVDAS